MAHQPTADLTVLLTFSKGIKRRRTQSDWPPSSLGAFHRATQVHGGVKQLYSAMRLRGENLRMTLNGT